MKILITGASGFIGKTVIHLLQGKEYECVPVQRMQGKITPCSWDPDSERIDSSCFEGASAVIHLAGESIAGLRWSRRKKSRIAQSRVKGTALLTRTLASLSAPPQTLITASGVGYYGDSGSQKLEEPSPSGRGFLASVCREWEGASLTAVSAGIRVVHLRLGVVLHPKGGVLAKLLPLYRMGFGGRMGGGKQYLSWVGLNDVARAVKHVLETPSLKGPVNLCSPNPIMNRQFNTALSRALHRPAFCHVPAFAVKALFGEMGREMLLFSIRAIPKKLINTGFRFDDEDIHRLLLNIR